MELRRSFWAFLNKIAAVLILATVLGFAADKFLIKIIVTSGHSMEPAVQEGNRYLVDTFLYKYKQLWTKRKNDIVLVSDPVNHKNSLVKRVVGVPNETLRLHHCASYTVTDEELPRSKYFLRDISCLRFSEEIVVLGPDEYFVMGDNRSRSHDSRTFGPINEGDILGRVVICLWPPGLLRTPLP